MTTKNLQYIGTDDYYFESVATGRAQKWIPGQRNAVPNDAAALLLATGQFRVSPVAAPEYSLDPLTGAFTGLVGPDGKSLPALTGPIALKNVPTSKSDADANESGALFTLDIPANTLGPNSVLRVRTLWTVPSSAAAKRLRGRFGGIVLWNLDLTTHVSYPLEFIISNRNSLSSQIAQANNLSWAAALASSGVQTFSIDFATAQQFTITAQWPVAGTGSNNITLESTFVEHIYGA